MLAMAFMPIPTAVALVLAYFVARSTYRLFFHPLSNIPGPKFAAISYLPEFYYDVIRRGMYMWEIERMHQKYGMYNLHLALVKGDLLSYSRSYY